MSLTILSSRVCDFVCTVLVKNKFLLKRMDREVSVLLSSTVNRRYAVVVVYVFRHIYVFDIPFDGSAFFWCMCIIYPAAAFFPRTADQTSRRV